jgi:hypothetical protein
MAKTARKPAFAVVATHRDMRVHVTAAVWELHNGEEESFSGCDGDRGLIVIHC